MWNDEEGYNKFVELLEPTTVRLRIGLEEWLRLNVRLKSYVPTTCTAPECGFDGHTCVSNFVSNGSTHGCLCNKKVRVATAEYFHHTVKKLESTRCRLSVTEQEWIELKPVRKSKVPSTCINCNLDGQISINALHSTPRTVSGLPVLQACYCTGKAKYNTEAAFRKLAEKLQPKYSLEWDLETYITKNVNGRDKIPSKCIKCGAVGTVIPHKVMVKSQFQACGCLNATEHKVSEFIELCLSDLFAERSFLVKCHVRDPLLRGNGNGVLEVDAVVYEELEHIMKQVQLLFVEVDGPHHFVEGFNYAWSDTTPQHTFDHDLIKEKYVLSKGVSMVRLDVKTVYNEKLDWRSWLRDKLESAVNRELQPRIYRLSHTACYVSGKYADLRVGSPLDPNPQS